MNMIAPIRRKAPNPIVGFHCEIELRDRLERSAKQNGRGLSAQIRHLLDLALGDPPPDDVGEYLRLIDRRLDGIDHRLDRIELGMPGRVGARER